MKNRDTSFVIVVIGRRLVQQHPSQQYRILEQEVLALHMAEDEDEDKWLAQGQIWVDRSHRDNDYKGKHEYLL